MPSCLDLVFEEWKASLATRNKKREAVPGNFDDLFNSLKAAGATAEEAMNLLPKAIKAHQPNSVVTKMTYKRLKSSPKLAGVSEREFSEHWNDEIADAGTSSYFTFFPRTKTKEEEDAETEGKMTSAEERLQQLHADTFDILDVSTIQTSDQYMTEEDAIKMLGDKDE